MENLEKLLKENSYPGRGIVIGKSADGTKAIIVYFIMGRSVNSRNRIFVMEENDRVMRTKAFDPALLEDPSLVIYAPVKMFGNKHIVTNGDQTDTIEDYYKQGKGFEEALRTRSFEPDAPNFTPRISGSLDMADGDFSYKLSILKSFEGDNTLPQKFFFEYTPKAGMGHFIHTYKCDGHPRIPSFEGEPLAVELSHDIDSLSEKIWSSLNEDNKAALFVRYIDLQNQSFETRIINKLG